MIHLICFMVLCALSMNAQELSSVRILDYRIAASLDEQQNEISGSASVWLAVLSDSLSSYTFSVPANIDIESVRDQNDERYDMERSLLGNAVSIYRFVLPSIRYRDDSFYVRIEFERTFDTSSNAAMFINEREFIVQYSDQLTWLPHFGPHSAASASLELAVSPSFVIVSSGNIDTVHTTDEKRTWKIRYPSPVPLQEAFSLCGSKEIVERKVYSNDSLIAISFYTSPSRFYESFAKSVTAQLIDAASLFAQLTQRNNRNFEMKFAVIGDDNISAELIRAGNCIIFRNSPAFTVFDSSVFTRSIRNDWLTEVARGFALPHSDSAALFDDGWSGYLATRYILASTKDLAKEKQERLDLMINALSFFPSHPIAAGRTTSANETATLSFKGRYVFLMLEYLLGRESFDAVIAKMYGQFTATPITIIDLQSLCEHEYGSSLDWFFRQWIFRSSAPEFVLQWNTERTQRGMNVVKVIVEQRGDIFTMPTNIVFTMGSRTIQKRVLVEQAKQEFSFTFPTPPVRVEIDPNYSILRWILDIRILAHARSSRLFRVYNKNLTMSEQEALLTLQLDPNNNTGTAPIAYFSLGKIAVIKNDPDKAKELFLNAMQSAATDEAQLYPLLSLVRYANIVEMEGKRNEALPLYQRAILEGEKNPSIYAPVIVEAEKYLRTEFISSEELWYGLY